MSSPIAAALHRAVRFSRRQQAPSIPGALDSHNSLPPVPLPTTLQVALDAMPLLESLEPRQLLSGITQSGYVITADGDANSSNRIEAQVIGRGFRVEVNGAERWFDNNSQLSLKINGGNLADAITVDSTVTQAVTIDAKAGNDSIRAGSGNDTINAGDGYDSVDGGAGNDTASNAEVATNVENGGGPSNPTPSPNVPTITLVNSTLTVSGVSNTSNIVRVTYNWSTRQFIVQAGATYGTYNNVDVNWIVVNGGNLGDLLQVDSSVYIPATVNGGAGNDTIAGGGVGDSLSGGDGNDSITGGAGADSLDGGAGNDSLNGNAGNDSLNGGDGDDVLVGGEDRDTIVGGNGWDLSSTGESNIGVEFITGSTGDPTPVPTPPTNGAGIPPVVGNVPAPVARITSISGYSITAGQSVHVDGLTSTLNAGQPTTARYEWDFGDTSGRFNKLVGFNAAHIYDRAGTYTITLRVINEGGKTSTSTATVNVAAENRPAIYVSWNGNDNNPGTIDQPIRTFARAADLVQNASNLRIYFKRGESFDVTTRDMWIYGDNILIGAYGSGENPLLRFVAARDKRRFMIVTADTAANVTIENLTFDSIYNAPDGDQANMPTSLLLNGVNVAVRNNKFLDVGFALNGQTKMNGLLNLDNTAPKITGIRDYFQWFEGKNAVILGNSVANSTREHIVRIFGGERVLVYGNDLTNLNRESVDRYDGAKGVVAAQRGAYMYIANNKLNGPSGFGPLGLSSGLGETWARTLYGVFESNVQNNAQFEVKHGAEHIMVRNNVFKYDNATDIQIEGYNTTYQRGVVDLTIVNNTAINNGTTGNFIRMDVPVDGVKLMNNLYVAPNLYTGPFGTAVIAVFGNDLSSFTRIDTNNWSLPTISSYAEGGINFVGQSNTPSDFKTPDEWNAYYQVGTDSFIDVTLDGNYKPTSTVGATIGTIVGGVFTDFYGNYRSGTGAWTVGAVMAG